MAQIFEEFLEKRRAAASAYVKGDARAVTDLSVSSGAATFFDPGGDIVKGADAVLKAYRSGPKASPKSRFTITAPQAMSASGPACSAPRLPSRGAPSLPR
jgi:hypothetical protein